MTPASGAWILRDVVLPFALTRAALVAVALLAATSVPFGAACQPCDLSPHPWLNALSRWDGEAYLSIARDGYSFEPGTRSNVAFAPLLPMLMRGLAALAGRADDDSLLIAGFIVVNAALLIGLVYLVALGRMELDEEAARRAVLYLLVFPTTVFLTALYPESLFLALAIASVFEARRGRWWSAGALAALGSLARPFGVVLVIPLALERILQRRSGRRPGPELVALAMPFAAFLGWQAYLDRISGDPLLFLTAQQAYGRRPSPPWEGVLDLFDPSVYGDPWLVLGVLGAATALVIGSWRLLRPSTAACGTAIFLVTLSSGTLTSFPRYALALFPGFLVLGLLGRHRAIHVGYLAVASLLSALLTAMFAAWYWVA